MLPFVPPLRALAGRGHDVIFATPPIFARPLRRLGLDVTPVGPFLGRRALAAFHGAVGTDDDGSAPFLEYWHDILLGGTRRTYDDLTQAVPAPDVVLAHYHSIAALAAARRWGVPCASLAWGPACIPSRGYPAPRAAMHVEDLAETLLPGAADRNGDGWRDELAWAGQHIDPATNAVLADLGLEPMAGAPFSLPAAGDALLLASHACLLGDQPDWPTGTVQLGYPYFDRIPGANVTAALAFAKRGPAPVLVSFGTAIADGALPVYSAVIAALRRLDHRVIVLSSKLADDEHDDVFHAGFVPLADVVHACALVVHHGGPGTSTACLRAGIPSLVIPQFLDQPFNAAIVAAVGAGVALRPHELVGDQLLRALASAAAPSIAASATAVAERLASDCDPGDAIADAVESLG